jgi:hypothetical protein
VNEFPNKLNAYCASSSVWCFNGFLYTLTGRHSTISFGAGTDPIEGNDGLEDKAADCWWISSRTYDRHNHVDVRRHPSPVNEKAITRNSCTTYLKECFC